MEDIKDEYVRSGGNIEHLPSVPDYVDGCEVDFMVGIKYLRYFPAVIFQLP